MRSAALTYTHYHVQEPAGGSCVAQGAQPRAFWGPRGVCREAQEGGPFCILTLSMHTHTHGWCMFLYRGSRYNIVKQLSSHSKCFLKRQKKTSIIRKHQTNPNWVTSYKTTDAAVWTEIRPCANTEWAAPCSSSVTLAMYPRSLGLALLTAEQELTRLLQIANSKYPATSLAQSKQMLHTLLFLLLLLSMWGR